MPTLHHVLLAFAVLAAATASPVKTKTSPPFRIHQVAKTTQRAKNGPAAYARALRKFGGGADKITGVFKAADITASSVIAEPAEDDLEYTSPVTIGDQEFQLDFDTGSSDLWVLSSSLETSSSNHTFYTPTESATLQDGETWSISYGDGSSASGTVYLDTVTVGETVVTDQAVEAATKASSDFTSDSPEDGLLGLGFDTINTVSPTQAKTFISNAVDQGLENVFTALLKKGEAGSYTFGEIDTSQYTGEITYIDVDSSQGFWTFSPSSYSIGGEAGSASSSALTGIADTGTTLLLIDDTVVSEYYSAVASAQNSQTAGGYIFECNEELPDFTLVIEDYEAVVPGSYINYAANGDGTCYGGIQSDEGIGFAIYGDIFLKAQFVVFDQTQGTPRLGFANQA